MRQTCEYKLCQNEAVTLVADIQDATPLSASEPFVGRSEFRCELHAPAGSQVTR